MLAFCVRILSLNRTTVGKSVGLTVLKSDEPRRAWIAFSNSGGWFVFGFSTLAVEFFSCFADNRLISFLRSDYF